MNDRQLLRTIDNLTARIERLEKQNRFQASSDWMPANWWGRVAPTLPASKIVTVHGGWFWTWDGASGYPRLMTDTVYDFSGVTGFSVSQGYRWVVLRVDLSAASPTLNLFEGTESADLSTAENDFETNAAIEDLWGSYLPLCALMLRGDGNLGTAGAIENITLIDKEQSYILARDFRPWLHLHT